METMMIIGMIVVLVLALGYCMWEFYKDVKSTTNEELRIELKGVDKEED